MTTNEKVGIGLALGLAAVVGFLYWKSTKKLSETEKARDAAIAADKASDEAAAAAMALKEAELTAERAKGTAEATKAAADLLIAQKALTLANRIALVKANQLRAYMISHPNVVVANVAAAPSGTN